MKYYFSHEPGATYAWGPKCTPQQNGKGFLFAKRHLRTLYINIGGTGTPTYKTRSYVAHGDYTYRTNPYFAPADVTPYPGATPGMPVGVLLPGVDSPSWNDSSYHGQRPTISGVRDDFDLEVWDSHTLNVLATIENMPGQIEIPAS